MRRVCKVCLREQAYDTIVLLNFRFLFLKLLSFSSWAQNIVLDNSHLVRAACVSHTSFVNSQVTSEVGNLALTRSSVQRKTLIWAPLSFLVIVNRDAQTEQQHWIIPSWSIIAHIGNVGKDQPSVTVSSHVLDRRRIKINEKKMTQHLACDSLGRKTVL